MVGALGLHYKLAFLCSLVFALSSCRGATPDSHVCDASRVITLADVPDFVGVWVEDSTNPSQGYRLEISAQGALIHPAIGCAIDQYPLVFQDYNAMPGSDGPGTGYRRLEYVQITPSHLKFFWKVNRNAKYRSKEQEELMELELIDPQTLSFEFVDSKGPIELHKLP